MRRSSLHGRLFLAFLIALVAPRLVGAQAQTPAPAQASAPAVAQDRLSTYAKAHTAIGKVRDQYETEFAEPRNKKTEAQQELHDKYRAAIAKILQDHGLSDQEYARITYVVSTDTETRKGFDLLMGIAPPPPPAPAATMSSNPHVGHVMTSFSGTPGALGLMPTALAEARVVTQHAALAAKATANLDAMKLHASHIMHAIEPAAGATGPGAGYGLKKAATNVVTHIELAAKAQGASQNILTHSTHIATSARNTVQRVDEIAALARQIQAAGSAADAAALIAKLNTLAGQLLAGVDSNGDGKITWELGEGGLQHVEQHLNLMAQAEMPRN